MHLAAAAAKERHIVALAQQLASSAIQRLCTLKPFEPGTHLATTARKEQYGLSLPQ